MNGLRKQIVAVLCGLAGIATLSNCGNRQPESTQKTFKVVEVPPMYATSAQLQGEYLAMHYWDNFDFTDTAFVGSAANATEQAIVNYFYIPYASYDITCNGIKHTLDEAQKNRAMYAFFTSKMEQYLFHPNSPIRNEELFIPVLEHMVASDSLDVYHKNRPKAMLAEAQKNRPGQQAADIHFTMSNGSQSSLYDIKTDYTLVFFHNLDCGNCREVTALIDNSQVIKAALDKKILTVLAIYPDMAEDMWKKHLEEMPSNWMHGYDKDLEIEKQQTYVLRAIPTLYLIDKNHQVIMKDAAFQYVEIYLNNIMNPQPQQAMMQSAPDTTGSR